MKQDKSIRLLAVASCGGHWTQLMRLLPALEQFDTVFISTQKSNAHGLPDKPYFNVQDCNRKNRWHSVKCFVQMFYRIVSIRPRVIVTTGAAPGLMAIIIGSILGKKTLWIDSIANVERISMSGRIAQRFATKCLTQWPVLSDGKFEYKGGVIS